MPALKEVSEAVAILAAAGAVCPLRNARQVRHALVAAAVADEEGDDHHVGTGVARAPWGFDSWAPQQFNELFRFTRREIEDLMDALDFPGDEYWRLPEGHFTRDEAMLLYLRRMTYPCRYVDLQNGGFRAQKGALSRLFYTVSRWMYDTHAKRLLQDGLTKWRGRVKSYRDAVCEKVGIPGIDCFAFLDGTARSMSRPKYEQRPFYSGHKRNHCLQYLVLTAPDGMILYAAGPTNGAHQDNFLLHEHNFDDDEDGLLPTLMRVVGEDLWVYGDPIFARSEHVQKAFPHVEITAEQRIYNMSMNKPRTTVEHAIGLSVRHWAFVDFQKQQKLYWTRPGMLYLNAVFMTNCRTCINGGNQVSDYFDYSAPELRQYLSMQELQVVPVRQ